MTFSAQNLHSACTAQALRERERLRVRKAKEMSQRAWSLSTFPLVLSLPGITKPQGAATGWVSNHLRSLPHSLLCKRNGYQVVNTKFTTPAIKTWKPRNNVTGLGPGRHRPPFFVTQQHAPRKLVPRCFPKTRPPPALVKNAILVSSLLRKLALCGRD